MSDNRELKEKENTRKENRQSKERPTENKLNEDKSLSHNKCPPTGSATTICKQPDSTASVASTCVPFWKDRKIWIQIAIVGVQLAICVYTGFSSKIDFTNLTGSHHHSDTALESSCVGCNSVAMEKLYLKDDSHISSEQDLKDLLNKDWEERKETLREDLQLKITESLIEPRLREIHSQFNEIKEQMKSHKEDIDKVKSVMDESLGKLQNQINGTKKDMETLENDMIKDKNNVKTDIENILKSVGSLKNEHTQFKEYMKKIEINWTQDVEIVKSVMETKSKSVDESLENLQNQLDGTKEHMDNNMTVIMEKVKEVEKQTKAVENEAIKTNEKVKEVCNKITTLETKSKSVDESLENLQNQLDETKEHLENNMTEMKGKVKGLEKQIKAVENDATKTNEKVKEVFLNMNTLESNMTKTNERVEGVDGQLNVFFKELKENSIYIVSCLLAIVICIIVGGYTSLVRSNPKNETIGLVQRTGVQQSSPNSAIIEKLKRKELKNGMSIIYFDSTAKDFYRKVLKEIPEFQSLKMDDFCLIQRFSDLENVEPHNIVFIFVEHNDRNIILEDENAEIGDLRNQITKVFISLGCDVFVVYCKDKDSKDLPPKNLYNTRLTSIEKHPVLSTLSKKKKVMSINDSFHSYQVEHLKENVK